MTTQPSASDATPAGPGSRRSVVAVVRATPETVLDDVGAAMRMAGYRDALPIADPVLLKINISWQHWYPACSTSPWQLEGVIKTLREDGYTELIGAHNGTVVVDSYEGEVANKHKPVTDRLGVPTVHLDVPPNEWVRYEPRGEMLALDKIFPEGITVPASFAGKSIIQLPTMKTHVFTTMTGAMKNAFGGLLNRKRHWTHSVIHETLVDLLTIQKELHSGLFAVMDGTFAGDGPGPRAMRWHTPGVMLASADQVAIDAIAAKMMGLDPMGIDFIRIAHERGLGCGDPDAIEVVGEDISEVNYGFQTVENTFASRGQKLIYWGPLKFLEKVWLRSPLVPLAYLASNVYHNGYWRNLKGKRRIREALQTPWGKLFEQY